MKAKIENNRLYIELEIAPRPSKSGKTEVIASTQGNQRTELLHQGKQVVIGVNAYVYKD